MIDESFNRDFGFDYERVFKWRDNRNMAIATECFRETDNGKDGIYITLEDGSKETYHESYREVEFFANQTTPKEYCYLNLALNIYPLLLRLFPITNGCSPIGGKHDTIGTSFQKLSPLEQNEQAPIIARGFVAWFIAWQRKTNEQEEDYESDMDDFELDFMQGYFRDMQERYCCYLHVGRRWKGKDLTTPFEDEHLKTETEYYEQAKVSLPKYLGKHHPQLVKYALEFGKDYIEFAKETIAARRKYTEEQATAHRQGDKPTEGKEVAVSMARHKMFAEADHNRKLEDAVSKLSLYMGEEKAKCFLITTEGMTPTNAARRCPILEHGEGRKVYDIWCMYNDKTPTKSNYQNTFARKMKLNH